MALTTFTIKQGDRLPALAATLKFADGTIKDLTGHTVKFLMRSAKTGTVKVNGNASVVLASAGTVRYDWAGSDTDTVGHYQGEFETTETATGKKTTFPNSGYLTIRVGDDIA